MNGITLFFLPSTVVSDGDSAADDIADKLQQWGIGTIAANLFVNKEPQEKPRNVPTLTVYDTGGFDSIVTATSRDHQPTVQIMAAGTPGSPDQARSLLEKVRLFVESPDKNMFFASNNVQYFGGYIQGSINFVETDRNNIGRYSLNLRLYRTDGQKTTAGGSLPIMVN